MGTKKIAKKKSTKKPAAKKRAKQYEPKLKVHGTFLDLVRVSVDVDKKTDKAIGKTKPAT